jgi:hypothetical protein
MEGTGTIMATSLKSLRANSITPVIVTAGVSSGVKITSVTPSVGLLAGGQTVTVAGSGFSSGAVVYVDSNTCSTTYVSSTSLTFTSPAKNLGAYHLYVYNTDGSVGVKPNGITYSTAPSWVTASGALTGAIVGSSHSQSVNATSDSTITYSVTSGSLPTGLSLNSSNGQISGTTTTAATSNFTITATDSENQTTSRSFSIESTNVTIDYLVVAGGGGGGMTPPQGYGSGGGAGGYLTASSIGISSGITYTITVGAGGTRAEYGGTTPTIGGNSSISGSGFTTVTSIGGGRGSTNGTDAGGNGGSGGGGGKSSLAGKGVYPDSTYIDAPRQGYDGGNGSSDNGGAGGGAGAAGGSGASAAGGIGLSSSITGTATYYAGGGGGGSSGAGGLGGGGSLSYPNGVTNTGGGGAASPGAGTNSGSGGSGVVILKINGSAGNVSITGTPPDTIVGSGYTVYKFTSSGSITFN